MGGVEFVPQLFIVSLFHFLLFYYFSIHITHSSTVNAHHSAATYPLLSIYLLYHIAPNKMPTQTGSRRPHKNKHNNNNNNNSNSNTSGNDFKSLKALYRQQLPTLRELFPGWSQEDLVATMHEANGDLELTIGRIMEGEDELLASLIEGPTLTHHTTCALFLGRTCQSMGSSQSQKVETSSKAIIGGEWYH